MYGKKSVCISAYTPLCTFGQLHATSQDNKLPIKKGEFTIQIISQRVFTLAIQYNKSNK